MSMTDGLTKEVADRTTGASQSRGRITNSLIRHKSSPKTRSIIENPLKKTFRKPLIVTQF